MEFVAGNSKRRSIAELEKGLQTQSVIRSRDPVVASNHLTVSKTMPRNASSHSAEKNDIKLACPHSKCKTFIVMKNLFFSLNFVSFYQ